MKMAVFWVLTPCSLVEVYRRFRGACCLHHQGDERLLLVGNVASRVLCYHLMITHVPNRWCHGTYRCAAIYLCSPWKTDVYTRHSICGDNGQSPFSETNSCLSSQEVKNFPATYETLTVRYVQKSLPLVRSYINPVHTLHFNIILSSTPMTSKRSLPFRFSDQHFVHIFHLSHSCHMPQLSRPQYDLSDIWWRAHTL
jgi:hypothetical protein